MFITQNKVNDYNEYYDEQETIQSLQQRLNNAAEQFLFDREGQDEDRFNERYLHYNEYLDNENIQNVITCREFLAYVDNL